MNNVSNDTINSAANTAQSTTERLANRANDAVNSARSTVQDGIDNVTDRASAAADWASDRYDDLGGMSGIARSGLEYMRSYPYVALGAALVIGFLIGRSAKS